ncbi:MAG TPA: Hsp33 family molecular chaperone HslO [Candidatus Baltobacteraceae bacterium]|nr:Hsp33 family molecular chaperone HslO [Candidatus Baltobacteraceae bacterium]
MPDLLLGASSNDAGIAVFAAVTTDLVRDVQRRHDLWPTATAAVGRLTTGAVLFGASLKGPERISLRIDGDGPLKSATADAWLLDEATLGARGYAVDPHVDLPIDARGKFDVAGAIGKGSLRVTKSYESGQPYVGVVALQSGEIAEDLAVYLGRSEQIPSVVALGVLANPTGIVAAGGVLAQVLPGADERAIVALEARALAMRPVTQLIAEHADAHALLHALAGDLELRAHRSVDIRFACLCTQQRVEAALAGLGGAELRTMAREREESEATCEFCKKIYVFTSEDLLGLAERLES